MGIVEQYLLQLKTEKRRLRRAAVVLTALSLLVAVGVSWNLRMTGITLANDACCGFEEHQHTEACMAQSLICGLAETPPAAEGEADAAEAPHIHEAACYASEYLCGQDEHLHTLACYSDPNADTETALDWQEMFAAFPRSGDLREDLTGIAKTQVGYAESTRNFEADANDVQHGYTRYGAWYGAPYGDWSAMFVSFCLHYAGAEQSEFPASSGADTMAALWDNLGKYEPAGQYVPVSGDLVFFDDNTVGIVTEVQSTSLHVIRGDDEDAVRSVLLPLQDASITGWGITAECTHGEDAAHTDVPGDLPDVLTAPVVFIFEGDGESAQTPKARQFSLQNSRAAKSLLAYLKANGGSYFFTLLDLDNEPLPGENNNYIAEAGKTYKLTLTVNSPKGFLPGTYTYEMRGGVKVAGGEGDFILDDGTNVGNWIVEDSGHITLNFNENINNRTGITISCTMGIQFEESDDLISFDGLISVKVEPPAAQKDPTELSKWGSPDMNAGKINWSVSIVGHADSQIPGSILTDEPALSDWSRPHSYTQSDMDNGLRFGVTDPDGGWHNWTVYPDDPLLTWDESGWSYQIPETAVCDYCGELALGNEGWSYVVDYTSTPTPLNTPGTFDYENKVTVDGQVDWGWSNFTHGQNEAIIKKNGSFVADAEGGGFLWEVQVTIPGRAEGERAEYAWFFMDEMRLLDASGIAVGRVQNDVNLSRVTANYNGTVIEVPRIQDATDEDMFAWYNSWTDTTSTPHSVRTINLFCRCQCTPETCHWSSCGDYWYQEDDGTWASNGFCQCWTETQNMTFNFVYETQDLSLITDYGALGYQVSNLAQLYYMPDPDTSIRVSHDDAKVTIPNLFEKQLTNDYNGYTAHYTITVNEAKAALTDGSPLTIHDMMTDTLAYISGSLVITAESSYGTTRTLQQGTDYTVTYDGTGNQTDPSGESVHVLDIVILHPQPVTYTLNYDATLIMPEQVTSGVKYSNSASIMLWGRSLTSDSAEKVYADINIAAKSYAVEMTKTCARTGLPLSGAVFGLYNAQGGLITSGTTDQRGNLRFETNVTEGIILLDHELYYLQEIQAPPAYQLDDTKYWFCFCSGTEDTCSECSRLTADGDALRIPFDTIGLIGITNAPSTVVLPATGGIGTPIYMLCGLILVLAPLGYGLSLRRKHERRIRE